MPQLDFLLYPDLSWQVAGIILITANITLTLLPEILFTIIRDEAYFFNLNLKNNLEVLGYKLSGEIPENNI